MLLNNYSVDMMEKSSAKKKRKKKSTKLYLLFTIVKDKKKKKKYMSVQKDANIWKSLSRPLKPSLPFSHMNYSGRARDVKRDQTSPCER